MRPDFVEILFNGTFLRFLFRRSAFLFRLFFYIFLLNRFIFGIILRFLFLLFNAHRSDMNWFLFYRIGRFLFHRFYRSFLRNILLLHGKRTSDTFVALYGINDFHINRLFEFAKKRADKERVGLFIEEVNDSLCAHFSINKDTIVVFDEHHIGFAIVFNQICIHEVLHRLLCFILSDSHIAAHIRKGHIKKLQLGTVRGCENIKESVLIRSGELCKGVILPKARLNFVKHNNFLQTYFWNQYTTCRNSCVKNRSKSKNKLLLKW